MKIIVSKIKKFVEEECKKSTSKYGYEHYLHHILLVTKYAKRLAKEFNVDEEVIEIAALLHDIGSTKYGRKNHHINGAKIAEKKLREFEYENEKIVKIKNCILNHRGSIHSQRKSIEEKIIADADAISVFDNIEGQFNAAFVFEKKTQKQARKSVKRKIINSWKKISLIPSKNLVRKKFNATMILFK
ncbi:MAG: HD domain-containing protein [Nanoarchaeota archaeon]